MPRPRLSPVREYLVRHAPATAVPGAQGRACARQGLIGRLAGDRYTRRPDAGHVRRDPAAAASCLAEVGLRGSFRSHHHPDPGDDDGALRPPQGYDREFVSAPSSSCLRANVA
ncbi:hypothetical protein GCM10010493_30960 [Streptomyces lavendulae subsp. grasserius]